jgi:hypothetical protein
MVDKTKGSVQTADEELAEGLSRGGPAAATDWRVRFDAILNQRSELRLLLENAWRDAVRDGMYHVLNEALMQRFAYRPTLPVS